MKKVLSFLIAFSMILSVFAALPLVSSAAEVTLSASTSYTHASSKGKVTMHGYPSRPYALSWPSSSDGYRTGYIAFPFGDVDLKGQHISKATLNLTVSKTQNMNESNSGVNIYAVDYSKVDGSQAPTSDILLTTFNPPSAVQSQGDYTYPVSIDIDLTEYLETYPYAEGVGILLTNRDDVYSMRGMIGFYGYDEGANAPTLTLTYGAEASLSATMSSSDGKIADTKNFTSLYAGDSFEVTEDVAPIVVKVNDTYYARDEIAPVILKAGQNTLEINYNPITIASADTDFEVASMIDGGTPVLPKTLSVTTTDGKDLIVPVEWEYVLSGSRNEKYQADLGNITAKIEVPVLSCDSSLSRFTSSGSSDGANFGSYNDIELSVGGGNVILDSTFKVDAGTNMLIVYGDSTTTEFNGAGALLRMFANKNANEEYVFEYYNSGWVQSDVICEYGVQYLARMTVDVTNKTYSILISADGDEFVSVCEDAAFRNSSLSTIDRMFFSGDVEITDFRAHWVDGYSKVVVSSVNSDGENIADDIVLKCTTGSTYTAAYLPKLHDDGGVLYVMDDVNYTPSIKVTDNATLEVGYHKVEIASYADIVTVVVQGDSTINLPSSVKLTLSDDQVVAVNVNWNSDNVNTGKVDEYTVEGEIEGLVNTTIEATVKVREVTTLPKTTENTVATNNGGWNWYVEPSGTHIQRGDELATRYESGLYSSNGGYTFQHDKTYMGWVEDEGTIVVAELDHDTDEYKRVELHPFLESDDHNNPAVVVLPDGRIMVFYSMHTNEPYMYYCVTKNPEDISEWNPWQRYYCYTEADGRTYNATYPSVFIVHDDEGIIGNDVIYVGWRGVHWKPTFAKFSIPDENGVCEMVMKQTQFANTTYGYSTYSGNDAPNAKTDGGLTDDGRRPYTKYDYDFDRNKIYITFTANHPDNDKRNHIYYIYLDIEDQNLYTAKDNLLQPLPKENDASYKSQGAAGTNGQWGIITVDLVDDYPELLVFDASEQTGQPFNPRNGDAERRGWTWDIKVNEAGEPCIVYVDVTATPPGEDGSLPTKYLAAVDGNSRSHHYYWYARWDSETQTWVKTFLTYGGKWFHENATQERCYSGGLTFDHNADDANVIYLAIPTMGEYGNVFEIYRWESEDHGATWTIREPLTENSKINNARPNAIYNYKENEDGTHAGPRLLWISGEYRYWMNYEYKTGVMTDYASEGFVTQDSPEMFADAFLYADGELATTLPVGEDVNITGKFNLTNISIGDGQVYLALVHYGEGNTLKSVKTVETTVPGRSVPQIGMIGAPKTLDGSLSPLGDPEIVEEIDYTATIEEGDKIKLFAWNSGIEHPMSSIISIPFEATTDGNKYADFETFSYMGTEKLILDENPDTFNGWIGKAYNSGAKVSDQNYAAITKAPFGNTGLHLYHTTNSNGAIMASHALPDSGGKDYTIRFTMRYINEMSWNNTDNAGFTLSHGVPVYNDPVTSCALQFRHRVVWQEENGRGTSGHVRNTRWFDGGSMSQIFVETDGPDGVGFKNDALMVGSLYTVVLNVHPSDKKIDFSINDGHRTFYVTRDYVDADSYDWENNPVDTITFSVGLDTSSSNKKGEIYIDNYSVEIAE